MRLLFLLILISMASLGTYSLAEANTPTPFPVDTLEGSDLERLGKELERRTGINPNPSPMRRQPSTDKKAQQAREEEAIIHLNATFWLVFLILATPLLILAGLTLKSRLIKWTCPQCNNADPELLEISEAPTQGMLTWINQYECRCLACGWCWVHPPPKVPHD